MSGKLAGKVALVTGASKGIGVAIAKHLAAEGANVAVNYNSDKSGAERVVSEINKQGGKAVAVQGSLANEADVRRIFVETKKALGKLDILVNNAGVYDFKPLEDVTPDHFHWHFDTNVLGLILASQEAAKEFEDRGGAIINIGSVAATTGPATAVVYAATKGAVDTITRTLANELGPRGIRVNAVNPGMVATEGAADFVKGDFRTEVEAATPLGRIGVPDDIGPAVAFLASPQAGWITGQSLIISGGYR
jgi:3-oxoacyl-[acyl-carrier protein] reductase